MFALVSPEKIQLPLGAVVRLPATWQNYQKLGQQRGDGSIPRIKYGLSVEIYARLNEYFGALIKLNRSDELKGPIGIVSCLFKSDAHIR